MSSGSFKEDSTLTDRSISIFAQTAVRGRAIKLAACASRSVYLDDAGLLAEPKSTIDSQQVVGATACRNDEVATPLVRSP